MIGAKGKDDGLALTPPLGWRSWNLYGGNVNQDKMITIMDGMVRRTRMDHLGNLVSLCDLGYCDVGLDDLWQDGHSPYAAEGMHYHDPLGNPLVNLVRFPSLFNMTNHAKKLGLSAGWYSNNCAYNDQCQYETGECEIQIRQDVKALVEYGFSSLKIDGCGNEKNLTLWNKYIEEYSTDAPILVENCHANRTIGHGCADYHFYRTSVDIRNNYASILNNLNSVEEYRVTNSSYPGCWAYPDMLQVGVRHGLDKKETRSHFASWAIVSSPLTLSHDVNDDVVMDDIWDLISNREILAINQAYIGDSGGVYDSSFQKIVLSDDDNFAIEVPIYQYLSKPIGEGKVAVLLMNNSGNKTLDLVANFKDIPSLNCSPVDCVFHVRDIFHHADLGNFHDSWSVSVESHDSAFIIVEEEKSIGLLSKLRE